MNILVVDDDQSNQLLARAMLNQIGHDAVPAFSGEEALNLVTNGHVFDVILMDINMTGMDGFETTRQLRACGCESSIYALTASDFREVADSYQQAGMDGYLDKPIYMDRLKNLLNSNG